MEEETKSSPAPSPKPRKRRGRPPKAKAQTQTQVNVSEEDLETGKLERAPTASPTSCECRRSSRKKVTKFDVRDLLKKNRKTSKTQIEAGLDSNASTTQEAIGSDEVAGSVPTSSNQSFGILKSSQSKIIEPQSTQIGKLTQESPPGDHDAPTNVPASCPQLPRKRGRPRKLPRVVLKDVVKCGTDTSLSDSVTNSTNSTSISVGSEGSDVSCIPKMKHKTKLRVNIKRINMPTSGESSGCRDLSKSIQLSDETNLFSCVSLNTTVELTQEQAETDAKADLKTEPLKLLPAADDDSNSQIFKEIKSTQTETKGDEPKEAKEDSNIDHIFAKKEEQTLNTEGESKLIVDGISDGDVEVGKGKTATQECKKDLAEEELTAKMTLEAMTPSPVASEKRRSKRSSLRGSFITTSSSSSKLTLEQTFAQIAAKSTESILMFKASQVDVEDVNTLIDLIDDSNSYTNKYNVEPNIELESKMQLSSAEVQLAKPSAVQLDNPFEKDKLTEAAITSDEKQEEEKEIATQMPKSESLQLKEGEQKMKLEEKLEIPDEQQPKEVKEPTDVPIDESVAQPYVEVAVEPASKAESPPEEKQQSSRSPSSDSTERTDSEADKKKTRKKLKKQTAKLEQEWEQCKKQDKSMDKEEDSSTQSNLLHPLNTSQEPNQKAPAKEPSPKPSKSKKKQLQRHLSRQSSMDSISSGSLKRKSGRVNDALQLALIETESSESTSSGSKEPSCGLPTPTSELDAQHPLKNIVKLIEDGATLLEREQTNKQEQPAEDEFAQRVANMETPATTPSTSPQLNGSTEENSVSTGVRRSHRIKKKPQMPKTNLGHDNKNNNCQTSTSISMETQLAELAQIEAINEQFLRHEGLNTFQPLKENFYRCARQVSQENAEMQCDCFLTGDEEAMGHLCCGARCINRMLMIECGPLCTNGARCTNKRFQQHQCWPCRVFRTAKKGCGITAELQIPSGEFIMEYVGEVIDSEEFERRQHLYSRDRNRHYYFMALRGEAIIDATAKGNISRYINHSCDPNAETQKWTVNGELRIGFFSLKTINPGEEITFDYQYQRYGRDAQRCYCEASNCRGWIGGEPDSDEGERLAEESDTEAEEQELDEQEQEVEQEAAQDKQRQKIKSIKTIKSKSKLKLQTSRHKQRKDQPKSKDREYKAGRWLRPSSDKSVARQTDKLEDPDVLEQLKLLNRSGLKNQADTLRFSRCMVRAKLLQTRLQLLGVLTRGELPCRRLFLDYHGLRLLHAWISESGTDNQLRQAMLNALESLPIPNKTMLNDSRIYQSVQLWSTAGAQKQQQKSVAEQEVVHQQMLDLLHKWDSLPETFRIPKRERIEQMKEHEREADRQLDHQMHQHAVTALEDSNSNSAFSLLTSDPYRQDRFRRDTINRYEKPKSMTRMSGNNTICSTSTTQPKECTGSMATTGNGHGISKTDPRRRSDLTNPSGRFISKELRRSLFEQKVAKNEAEKRMSSEDWREHVVRCEYFGAAVSADPKLLPFYENTETNEWFNKSDVRVPAPLRCGKENDSPKVDDTDEVEYKLPPSVEPLPPSWHWALSEDGSIYYFNLKTRITQWEPPNAQQRLEKLVDSATDEEQTSEEDPDNPEVHIDTAYVCSLSPRSLSKYVDDKVRERRELRRNRLVSVRMISPRRDEDRFASQLESRRYKENKEKIRRRKEIYRRKHSEQMSNHVGSQSMPSGGTLAIPRYLYSSDEDDDADDRANLTLLDDAIVDGVKVKHVDELEAMSYSRSSHIDANTMPLNMEPSTSKSALAALSKQQQFKPMSPLLSLPMPPMPNSCEADVDALLSMKRKLPLPPHTPDSQKKKCGEREKKRKPPLSSTTSGREACDKFRTNISGPVAEYLRPYRKDSCKLGRISSEEDYQFLVKRLSHHITTKEMRYCDVTGHPLACTESVKKKTYEFIKQYMEKKGRVYEKPEDEPDCY
ncbi:hypothetical protein ACLKA6_008224 [Drosophila palustris]